MEQLQQLDVAFVDLLWWAAFAAFGVGAEERYFLEAAVGSLIQVSSCGIELGFLGVSGWCL